MRIADKEWSDAGMKRDADGEVNVWLDARVVKWWVTSCRRGEKSSFFLFLSLFLYFFSPFFLREKVSEWEKHKARATKRGKNRKERKSERKRVREETGRKNYFFFSSRFLLSLSILYLTRDSFKGFSPRVISFPFSFFLEKKERNK